LPDVLGQLIFMLPPGAGLMLLGTLLPAMVTVALFGEPMV